MTDKRQNKGGQSGKRMKEILAVLRSHQLARGITPEKLRRILEDLGPTYVKLGQVMSMRSDMLPEKYCRELAILRTDVKPLPFETVRTVVEQELKMPIPDVFQSIELLPLGSASIAQVHAAVLANGEKVVIKVQRPGIKGQMAEDIAMMKKACGILKIAMGTGELLDFGKILDELWKTSQEEMNFLREAEHLELFYENQKEIKYVTCPVVHRKYSTARLLVMGHIDGIRIDRWDLLSKQGYDRSEIGEKAAENFCKQILEDGFFHADPHPGNLWIEAGRIVWLDLGMTGILSRHYREVLKNAISSILKNDIYGLKDAVLAFGEHQDIVDQARLYTDLDNLAGRYMKVSMGDMDLGRLIEDLLNLLRRHRIGVPSEITLLGRSLITMQGTLADCSPEVNMMQILSAHMASLLTSEFNLKKEAGHCARDLYGSVRKSLEIPAQFSDLLNITKNGQLRIQNVETGREAENERRVRLGNRMIWAGIASAFLISSSLLCLSGMEPVAWGIPGPAFFGFVLTAGILAWLLATGRK